MTTTRRPSVVRQADGSFVADARAKLEEVVAVVGTGFDVGEALKDVDTLGGYLVTQAGRVPVRGELVQGPNSFEIEVLDADPRRVKKVKIHRSQARRPGRANRGHRSSPCPMLRESGKSGPDSGIPKPPHGGRDPLPIVPFHHAGLGMAARRHRLHGRRALGAGARAVSISGRFCFSRFRSWSG